MFGYVYDERLDMFIVNIMISQFIVYICFVRPGIISKPVRLVSLHAQIPLTNESCELRVHFTLFGCLPLMSSSDTTVGKGHNKNRHEKVR